MSKALFNRVMLAIEPGVAETEVAGALRDTVGAERGLDISLTSEEVETQRQFMLSRASSLCCWPASRW